MQVKVLTNGWTSQQQQQQHLTFEADKMAVCCGGCLMTCLTVCMTESIGRSLMAVIMSIRISWSSFAAGIT